MTTADIAELLLHQVTVNRLRREFLELWNRVDPIYDDDITERDEIWREFLSERLMQIERTRRLN